MGRGRRFQALRNGRLKGRELFVILRVQTLLFDKLPEPFDEIQVGRVRGQKQ